jgi:hypothetical protein
VGANEKRGGVDLTGSQRDQISFLTNKGKAIHLKPAVHEAIKDLVIVDHLVVHRRGSRPGDEPVEFEIEREKDPVPRAKRISTEAVPWASATAEGTYEAGSARPGLRTPAIQFVRSGCQAPELLVSGAEQAIDVGWLERIHHDPPRG